MEILRNNAYTHVRGFNYQPSYASHGIEIWGDKFDLNAIDRELGLGKKYFPKINTIRLWLSFDAFIQNQDRFMNHVESVFNLGEKYDLKFIITLFNAWHSIPDFGGVSPYQIGGFGVKDSSFEKTYGKYLKRLISQHAEDPRILLWDLCNEPFGCPWEESCKIYIKWLTRLYEAGKQLSPKAPFCVGSLPAMWSMRLLEPVSDVLTPHPYYVWNVRPNREDYTRSLDEFVAFANETGKAMIASETCWGSLDDKHRSEIVRFELSEQVKRGIGFTAHLLHETYVADGHREEYGPLFYDEADSPFYMAFINMDGSIRPYHEVFNEFC